MGFFSIFETVKQKLGDVYNKTSSWLGSLNKSKILKAALVITPLIAGFLGGRQRRQEQQQRNQESQFFQQKWDAQKARQNQWRIPMNEERISPTEEELKDIIQIQSPEYDPNDQGMQQMEEENIQIPQYSKAMTLADGDIFYDTN